MGYYDWQSGIGLREVIRRWRDDGDKMYDRSMPVLFALAVLWPHREYTWSREDSRRTNEEWDRLVNDMKRGWNKREPLHFAIGRKGGAKVGEGNHRLAIAKQLGIKQVPVEFHFQMKVAKQTVPPRRPLKTLPVERKSAPKSAGPRKPLSPEQEKRVSDILRLLGG